MRFGKEGQRQNTTDHFNAIAKDKVYYKPYSLRLSADERAFLDQQCQGAPWSSYIRECVFGRRASKRNRRTPKVDDRKLASALATLGQSRVSSNLNQLAKSVNTGTLDVSRQTETQLQDACAAVLEMRKALLVALGMKGDS